MNIAFLEEHKIPYIIRKSKRARKQKLIISSSKLEIVIPARSTEKFIIPFIAKQQDWIIKNWNKTQNSLSNYAMPEQFADNAQIPYRGLLYKMRINQDDIIIPKIFFDNEFTIIFPYHVRPNLYDREIRKLYKNFLIQELEADITKLFGKLTDKTNITVNNYRLKQQKSRWGSCSSKGNINLNFNLIFAPKTVLEYVIIHEFCHLKHPNHSADFWQMVNSFCPSYKEEQNWLKANHHIINFTI